MLLDKLKTRAEREWYPKAAIEHSWGRYVLVHQIETWARERQSAAMTGSVSSPSASSALTIFSRCV